ncbi:phosphate/phosphite/phosphonate ABC transporter substrate-binding protein [Polynucleobacter sp. 80A-SIGWE]|uniref:phosphate/phosphite/phosphonate ABC transporter substrate-binding protein n=1 Tax=Polynucleobacter sp. 80A-SIGWE TaxID=2689100 RepID=UPI001C0C49CF|nr:phosphate/phosphite/phosphonate ABC transporter substrate-binding protein [Polynucleobacter sp. 80A-SIGWE]MBU3589327.1 phosphate/phosphite/phosphonate ABC transporter substrate-binding protein [Polynucleobacter sp. 80A-SIGWE]
MRSITKTIIFSCSILLPAIAFGKCIGDQNSPYPVRSVYVVPQMAASQLYVRWSPVLEKVGLAAGICFDLTIVQTIPDFERELLSGKPNFAFMNPYHEVMAYRAKGYLPLLADGKNQLDGIIVVRNKSKIENINDLRGAKLAFPAPNAFAASLLVRATLAKQGINIEPIYVKSHNNVYRSVIAGDVSAGGAVNNTLQREPAEVQEQLRVLFKTSGYMPHPFSVNPKIPLKERNLVVQAFLDLAKTDEGRRLLDGIQMPEPIPVNYARDYQSLEGLGLEKFVVNSAN